MSTKKKKSSKRKRSAPTVSETLKLPKFYEDPRSQLRNLKHKKVIKKLLEVWRGYKKHDDGYFTYDEGFSNILKLLELCECHEQLPKGSTCALQVNDSPSDSGVNLFSVLIDWYIHDKRDNEEQKKSVLKFLIDRIKNEDLNERQSYEKQVYLGELANFYLQLGPRFYREARLKYTELMKWLLMKWGEVTEPEKFSLESCSINHNMLFDVYKRFPEDDPMQKKMILWSFQCATLYSKLLQKGNLHILRECLPDSGISDTKMVNTVFKNIRDMLHFVALTEDEQFSGWAWAILADTMKIYEFIGPRSDRTCELPGKMSADQCMLEAAKASPNNPHALYLVGRHFRQKATSLDDFRRAVGFLEQSVASCKVMHQAYHHLGLAYRSMWILERQYPEVQLHTNQKKRGQHGRSAGNKNRQKQKQRNVPKPHNQRMTYSQLAARGSKNKDVEPQVAETSSQGAKGVMPASPSSSCAKSGIEDKSLESQFHKVASIPSIHPKKPGNALGSTLPKHYRTPDFFDVLRTNNPIEKSQSNNDNLQKSYDSLLKASAVVHNSSPRYLIDLARICISMQQEAAVIEQYFSDASELLDQGELSDAIDGAYLFEQWGLYDLAHTDDKLKTLNHLRKSIYFSVGAKQRSRVAFYKLLDHLDELAANKIKAGGDERLAIVKEKIYIHQLVEQFGKARELIKAEAGYPPDDLLKRVLEREENKVLLFELINCYHLERDHSSALDFLELYIKCCGADEPSNEEAKLALDTAISALPDDDDEYNDNSCGYFSQIFRWVFSDDVCDEEGSGEEEETLCNDSEEGSSEEEEDDSEEFPEMTDVAIFSTESQDDWLVTKLSHTFSSLNLETFTESDDALAEYGLGGTIHEAWSNICEHIDHINISLIDLDFCCKKRNYHDDVDAACCEELKCCLRFTRDEERWKHFNKPPIVLSKRDMSSKELVNIVIMRAFEDLESLREKKLAQEQDQRETE